MSWFRKSFRKNRRIWTGVIGAVVIVALLLGVTTLAGAHLGKQTLTGDFAQAGGVRPGDKVRVAGIDVGEVTDTRLAGNHVAITMKVDREVKVTANGAAEIKMSTLLGQRYIDLSLGDSPDEAPDGHIERTAVPYDLQRTIEEGAPILTGIDDQTLSQSIRTLNRQLAGVPAITRPTFEALTQMSEVITNRKDQINQLIADTKTITSIVDDNQAQLAVIVGQGRDLTQKITAREDLVTRMLDGIAELTEQASAVAGENADQFAPLMANLNTITQGLEKNRNNLRKLLEILPVTARMTNNILGDGPYANGYLPWGIFPDNWLCLARVVDGC
ncbi:MCE family protein [Gordonia sp. zg691]|uniref:MCE family protein n=1 Tax=Gordonia jinghuaiqii TaxID=2758710 RepID=A0A7D7QGD1_9ACTN|nr:MCE family protein [Gordonia jinghuaiqii]MBD0860121.1 MCE family protein [Gordonia jinghuaiqii]MCR5977288.1 MCE family protein [Gordonia jinghuaiqii]QMT00124.1 MCE family protein [Gordonia jinghuaiqii]